MKNTALSSQLNFSLFSVKKYFEKMKIGQFKIVHF